MWQYIDKGTKEAVIKNFNAVTSKVPADQTQIESIKAVVAAEINALKTNGCHLQVTGQADEEARSVRISVTPEKLSV